VIRRLVYLVANCLVVVLGAVVVLPIAGGSSAAAYVGGVAIGVTVVRMNLEVE
jgi:hypothetical protein